jgi:hypothetical protein
MAKPCHQAIMHWFVWVSYRYIYVLNWTYSKIQVPKISFPGSARILKEFVNHDGVNQATRLGQIIFYRALLYNVKHFMMIMMKSDISQKRTNVSWFEFANNTMLPRDACNRLLSNTWEANTRKKSTSYMRISHASIWQRPGRYYEHEKLPFRAELLRLHDV